MFHFTEPHGFCILDADTEQPLVLTCTGDFSEGYAVGKLCTRVHLLIQDNFKKIVLDLSGVTHFTTEGCDELRCSHANAVYCGRRLVFVCSRQSSLHAFIHTECTSRGLEVFDSVEEAQEALGKTAGEKASAELQITTREVVYAGKTVVVLDLTEGLTLWTNAAAILLKEVKKCVAAGKLLVLLNFTGVPQLDSSGIGGLVGSSSAVSNAGGKLELFGLILAVRNVLISTKLLEYLREYKTEAESLNGITQR